MNRTEQERRNSSLALGLLMGEEQLDEGEDVPTVNAAFHNSNATFDSYDTVETATLSPAVQMSPAAFWAARQAVLQRSGSGSELYMPPHRPLVGGGAAAAFEAARHDFYTQKRLQEEEKKASPQRESNDNGNSVPAPPPQQPSAPSQPSQQQNMEMLRLHHMNLLNEMQETAMMMNLAQQRMLQEQLQQQHSVVPMLQTSPTVFSQQQMTLTHGAMPTGLGNNVVFLAALRQQMAQQPLAQQQFQQQEAEEEPELQDGVSCSSTSTEEGEDKHPLVETSATLKELSTEVKTSVDEAAATKRPAEEADDDQEERPSKRSKN